MPDRNVWNINERNKRTAMKGIINNFTSEDIGIIIVSSIHQGCNSECNVVILFSLFHCFSDGLLKKYIKFLLSVL